MVQILSAIFPVFVLIALGYGAARGKLISAEGAQGIDAYVFYFAIPALLFRTMAEVELGDAAPWLLWACYYSGVALIWVLAGLFARAFPGSAAAGGSALAMGSSFGNILLMGIPVSVLNFGEAALIPAALIVAIHAPLHWVFATFWAEAAERSGRIHPGALLAQVVGSMARNPLILALAIGLMWNVFALPVPDVFQRIIDLLADSSVAAALFSLGLSLAAYSVKGNVRALAAILVLKLTVFPAIMWVLATQVFRLPELQAHVTILFAALPVGVNAYIFATRYRANIGAVSSAIMLSVPISALTLPVVLLLIGG